MPNTFARIVADEKYMQDKKVIPATIYALARQYVPRVPAYISIETTIYVAVPLRKWNKRRQYEYLYKLFCLQVTKKDNKMT